jgi:hypothetical protein
MMSNVVPQLFLHINYIVLNLTTRHRNLNLFPFTVFDSQAGEEQASLMLEINSIYIKNIRILRDIHFLT